MNLESECLARGNLETNPIAIKPETVGHVTEKSPGLPRPAAVLLPALPTPHHLNTLLPMGSLLFLPVATLNAYPCIMSRP